MITISGLPPKLLISISIRVYRPQNCSNNSICALILVVISILSHSGVSFYAHRLNEKKRIHDSNIQRAAQLQQFSLQSPNIAFENNCQFQTFALHSAIIGYSLADQKMLFGNTLLPAPTRLLSSFECVAAAVAKQPEYQQSAAMLRIDHGVVDPFSKKASTYPRSEASMSGPLHFNFSEKGNHH